MNKQLAFRAFTLLVGAAIFSPTLSLAAPKDDKTNRGTDARYSQLPPRMVEAIESRTGKKLTASQKQNLLVALRKRGEEMRASNERFAKSFSAITGVNANEMRGLMRRGRGLGYGGPRGERRPGGGRDFGERDLGRRDDLRP